MSIKAAIRTKKCDKDSSEIISETWYFTRCKVNENDCKKNKNKLRWHRTGLLATDDIVRAGRHSISRQTFSATQHRLYLSISPESLTSVMEISPLETHTLSSEYRNSIQATAQREFPNQIEFKISYLANSK